VSSAAEAAEALPSVPRLLNAVEAAEFLGIGRNTLYIWVRAGRVPHFKIGTAVRFDVDELRRWLEENRRGPEVAAEVAEAAP
jgi:excisionase family DNA binding protein